MPREIPMKFLPPREAARLLGMSIIALRLTPRDSIR
jgi:hypothetical protein